jgi:Domain of unknown function (DU1801).
MMKKMVSAASPDEYVAGLSGWQRACVENLRAAVRGAGELEEAVKWGHLVYTSNGPLLLIRAEEHRVLFGFWRGKRLQSIEKRLKASGKYELANLVLEEGATLSPVIARRLTKEAIALNKSLGDPRNAAKPKSTAQRPRAKRARA